MATREARADDSIRRVFATTGIHNFRDYGGYKVAGGGRLQVQRLFRSGGHCDASDKDLAVVDGLDLAAVIDLRSAREREQRPCRRGPRFRANVLFAVGYRNDRAPHLVAAGILPTPGGVRDGLMRAFRAIPFQRPMIAVFRLYFETLATVNGATLVHCHAGKDRTGIAVALLQASLGVHPDDIMEDFLLTNSAGDVEARIAALEPTVRARYGDIMSDEAVRIALSVEAEYLHGTFVAIVDRCGGLDNYLSSVLGITSAVRSALGQRLVQETSTAPRRRS